MSNTFRQAWLRRFGPRVALVLSGALALGAGDCFRFDSGDLTKASQELREGLEKASSEIKDAAGNVDPLGLNRVLEENKQLQAELEKLYTVLSSSGLGVPSLVPGSRVVFEVPNYEGSFVLDAWIGNPEQEGTQFISGRTYPTKQPLYASDELCVPDLMQARMQYGVLGGMGALSSQPCTLWNKVRDAVNTRFEARRSGASYGLTDSSLRTHDIHLRTGFSGTYPLYLAVRPLTESWFVVWRVFEEKNGHQNQVGTGELNVNEMRRRLQDEALQLPVGGTSPPVRVHVFRLNVPKPGAA